MNNLEKKTDKFKFLTKAGQNGRIFKSENESSKYDETKGRITESFRFWCGGRVTLFSYKKTWESYKPKQSEVPRYVVEIVKGKINYEKTKQEERNIANPTEHKIRYKVTLTETKSANMTPFERLMERIVGEGTCIFVEDINI